MTHIMKHTEDQSGHIFFITTRCWFYLFLLTFIIYFFVVLLKFYNIEGLYRSVMWEKVLDTQY